MYTDRGDHSSVGAYHVPQCGRGAVEPARVIHQHGAAGVDDVASADLLSAD